MVEVEISEEQRDFLLGKSDRLGGKFFDAFKTSKDLLMDQIFTIVTHQEMLNDLRGKK